MRLNLHRTLFVASAIMTLAGTVESFAQGFRAGEGVTDITPQIGTELAGFHKPPGKERSSAGVRQPASARALVFANTATNTFAIVSLDVCAVSQEFCREVKKEIARKIGIAVDNIHIGATRLFGTHL